MPLYQELTNQGRVVGGHFANATVLTGGLGAKGDLVVSLGFKRQKLNPETVHEWEDITSAAAQTSLASTISQAAAGAVLPGLIGKATGAAVGAAMRSGHTIRVDWADGKQSVIQLPAKLFMVFTVLLERQQKATEPPELPAPSTPAVAASNDIAEQIAKLASLHGQGILTDAEFAAKKTQLLDRL